MCVVTSDKKNFDNELLHNRILSFYKKGKNGFIKKLVYETMDGFIAMWPLTDTDGNLLTMWSGGSAYHINVFSLINDGINIVLESGSKLKPEIVDIDNDGLEEILISTASWQVDKQGNKYLYPETTSIFKWNGKAYVSIKTVPWKTRLDALTGKF